MGRKRWEERQAGERISRQDINNAYILFDQRIDVASARRK